MGQDRWTAAEYRRFLETGKEPVRQPGIRHIPDSEITPRAKAHFDSIRQSFEERDAETEKRRREIARAVDDAMREGREKRGKYGAKKIEEDGITFDSRHEHRVYLWLKARKSAGELRWVFVHVPFRFMNGVTYWADFMTIRADGRVEAVWDAKSGITAKNRDYVIKKKTLKAEWGIDVCEVYSKDADGRGGYYNPEWPIMDATGKETDSER